MYSIFAWQLLIEQQQWDIYLLVQVVKTKSALFCHFWGLFFLVWSDHLSFPLPETLHFPCLELGQILLLHVHATKFGPKGIMRDVLLLFDL